MFILMLGRLSLSGFPSLSPLPVQQLIMRLSGCRQQLAMDRARVGFRVRGIVRVRKSWGSGRVIIKLRFLG